MVNDGHWASHWSETIMFIRPTEPSPAADRIKADEVIVSDLMDVNLCLDGFSDINVYSISPCLFG